jgi:hypothetical protein
MQLVASQDWKIAIDVSKATAVHFKKIAPKVQASNTVGLKVSWCQKSFSSATWKTLVTTREYLKSSTANRG